MKLIVLLIVCGVLGSLGYSLYSQGKSDCRAEVALEKKQEINKGVETRKKIRKKLADFSDDDLDRALAEWMRPNP